jgi:phage terminase Nu1 subunit (DNA packaging protein)
MPVKTVTAKEVCRILAGDGHDPLTEMAVSKFVRDGMPKEARGTYDPVACMRWYIGRLRNSVKRKETETEDGSLLSLDKEQIRLTAAKADNEEMTAEERRNTLLPLEVYRAEQAKLVQVVKLKFLNLPSRLAPKLEALSRNEIKAQLTAAVKDTLTELARSNHVNDSSDEPASTKAPVKRSPARPRRKSRTRKR